VSATLRTTRAPDLDGVPGLVHGFEERLGPPGWESREDGRRRVAEAVAEHGRLYLLRQVHGKAIHSAPWEGTPEGDAGVAAEPGTLVAVETADCLPLLLVDPERRRAAAVHAGWRGTAAKIAQAAVTALVGEGGDASGLLAALGPGIGECCYEVGPDVREAFGPDAEAFFSEGPRGRPHLDVRAANVSQLLEAGVAPHRIHHVADCTFCRADRYYSYRRDGHGAGRMINFVGWDALVVHRPPVC
jgi:purine-nucleoside/S-methyl-5'-thioadenosine phosphorylase / adenosine deaminase